MAPVATLAEVLDEIRRCQARFLASETDPTLPPRFRVEAGASAMALGHILTYATDATYKDAEDSARK